MRLVLLLPGLLLCTACASTSDKTRGSGKGEATERSTESYGDTRPVPKANEEEIAEFNRIWELFRKDDPAWSRERDRFKRRGDAASYLLAGHLIRFYMVVNMQRERSAKALVRAKSEIVAVGAPCAPALIDLMILDRIPMPDGGHFIPDDVTRQDCQEMLERMGPQAIPDLLRTLQREDLGVQRRRLALALGGTKDPRAYDPLVNLLLHDPSWQVRADAATALASLGDKRAIAPLTEAVQKDPDPAVIKRAGKARDELARRKP